MQRQKPYDPNIHPYFTRSKTPRVKPPYPTEKENKRQVTQTADPKNKPLTPKTTNPEIKPLTPRTAGPENKLLTPKTTPKNNKPLTPKKTPENKPLTPRTTGSGNKLLTSTKITQELQLKQISNEENEPSTPRQITRKEFVAICESAIISTRESVAIVNQLEGYSNHHQAKKDRCMAKLRKAVREINKDNGYSITNTAQAIRTAGVSHCGECQKVTADEIIHALRELRVDADVNCVKAKTIDHAFLNIKIQLAGEKFESTWEVDSWDPRIIDKTMRPDGTIRNENYLNYGKDPILKMSFKSLEVDKNADPDIQEKLKTQYHITPAKPGDHPTIPKTPEEEMLILHKWLWDNYPLSDAYKKRKLPNPELTNLQQPSPWQVNDPAGERKGKKPRR